MTDSTTTQLTWKCTECTPRAYYMGESKADLRAYKRSHQVSHHRALSTDLRKLLRYLTA